MASSISHPIERDKCGAQLPSKSYLLSLAVRFELPELRWINLHGSDEAVEVLEKAEGEI
jgi:hypothetical protein